jgi:hypothetical protein
LTSSQANAERFTHDAALQAESQLRGFGFTTTLQEITDINVLWIGGNIFFDLQTGESKQVLLFVHREEDAAAFTKKDADSYVAFVKEKAAKFGTFTWFIDKSRKPGFFVIRGHQSV